jgi:hypothetical protein
LAASAVGKIKVSLSTRRILLRGPTSCGSTTTTMKAATGYFELLIRNDRLRRPIRRSMCFYVRIPQPSARHSWEYNCKSQIHLYVEACLVVQAATVFAHHYSCSTRNHHPFHLTTKSFPVHGKPTAPFSLLKASLRLSTIAVPTRPP